MVLQEDLSEYLRENLNKLAFNAIEWSVKYCSNRLAESSIALVARHALENENLHRSAVSFQMWNVHKIIYTYNLSFARLVTFSEESEVYFTFK